MRSLFLKPQDPILRKVAKQISMSKINSLEIRKIVKSMLQIAYGEQNDANKPIMVGLAAPQIGISKRIILVDTKADGKGRIGNLQVFINPEITWTSKKQGEWYEGCYSIPETCGIVSRPTSIKVRAYNSKTLGVLANTPPRWNAVEEKYGGYVARILQHEIDHLNGKFFVDLIKNPDHLHRVKKSEFPLYRNREAWRNWPKKYPLPLALGKLKKV